MIDKKHNIVESFGFAIQGIKTAIILNRNLKIHILFALLVLLLSFLLHLTIPEISIIIMLILLVIAAEMINTVVEEVVDLVTKEYREEAKYAKDVAAGMVLVVAVGSVLVGLFIFAPYLFKLIA